MGVRHPWQRFGMQPEERRRSGPAVDILARTTLAIILAGGRGTRLGALTDWRAKPSLPFGGKFRIIDFTLSNCVNSGIRHIGVCTQYRSQSLIRHLQRGWSFLDGRFGDFVELLPAEQRERADWYSGTASAVHQNLELVHRGGFKYVLVLAGDHVYKMDYGKMLEQHVRSGARATIACIDVPLDAASAYGVVRIDEEGRVAEFQEKPAAPAPMPDRTDRALASMGIYVFDAPFLAEQLRQDAREAASSHDFGHDVIPRMLAQGEPIFAHAFATSCVNMREDRPYWRDVGTIDAYWEANIDLTRVVPELNLYDEEWPIWTWQEQKPPAKFVFDDSLRRGTALDSLVSGGCILSGSVVRRSLLFTDVHVHSFCDVEDSVVLPNVDIGRHCTLRRAVIDKDCRLPDGFSAGVDHEADAKRFHVTAQGVTLVVPEMLGQVIHGQEAGQ